MDETRTSRSDLPPASAVGVFGWMHRNLFSSPFNIARSRSLSTVNSSFLNPQSSLRASAKHEHALVVCLHPMPSAHLKDGGFNGVQ